MHTNRFDLYKEVHKGVRKELFDLVILAGSTEYQKDSEFTKLQNHFYRTYNLLEIHAYSEDKYVEPLVKKHDAGLASKLEKEHIRLEKGFVRLKKTLTGITPDDDNAVRNGRFFYLSLTQFVAKYLQHLADEELVVMPLLWDSYDDENLMDVAGEIRANVPPSVTNNLLSCMIPAMSHSERTLLFWNLKKTASKNVFESVCELAKKTVSPDERNDLDKLINDIKLA